MLLPNDWLENSIECYIYQYKTKSQKIYWVILAAVIITFISLPFIYVDISVQGGGIVRPVAEKTQLISPITELVDSVYIKEGQTVRKGDTILRFRSVSSDYKIIYQSDRLKEFDQQLHDLRFLSAGQKPDRFLSPIRRQEYIYYDKRHKELETQLLRSQKDYDRNKTLFEKKVISEQEYEQYFFSYESARNELASFTEGQLSSWQSDYQNLIHSRNEMNTSLQQERMDQEHYILRSPVNGNVDQFSGIYKGSSIQAGQPIAVISPDSLIHLEIYVTPRNIGYIRIGMPVNIQVESFNYNEWGMIGGHVIEISSDFLTDNQGNSYYKVKCSMEKDHLTLKNGTTGKLKKGMNVSAHFMICKRSVLNLLYQRMDDWINPSQHQLSNQQLAIY